MIGFGPLCAFMSSVTWAFGSSAYSQIAKENSPFAINLARAAFALPFFIVAAFVSGGRASFAAIDSAHFYWLALSMLVSYVTGDAIFLISSRSIGVPAALAIASAYPLLTSGWAVFFEGETLSALQTAGLLLTVGGVIAVILSTNGSRPPGVTKHQVFVGVLLAMVTTVCWALNSYSIKKGGTGINAAAGSVVRALVAIALCPILAKLVMPRASLILPRKTYGKWAWLFVMEAFGGSYFYVYGLANSSLAIGSTLSSVSPVLAVPVSLAMGLETFSWKRTAGVVFVVLGIWLLVAGKIM